MCAFVCGGESGPYNTYFNSLFIRALLWKKREGENSTDAQPLLLPSGFPSPHFFGPSFYREAPSLAQVFRDTPASLFPFPCAGDEHLSVKFSGMTQSLGTPTKPSLSTSFSLLRLSVSSFSVPNLIVVYFEVKAWS